MKRIKKISFIMLALVAVVGLLDFAIRPTVIAGSANAGKIDQTKQTAVDSSTGVDEQALAILKKATSYLTGLNQFRLKGLAAIDVVQDSGQKLQFGSTAEVTVKRPNRIYASRTLDEGDVRRFWYDGAVATLYEESSNVYTKIPVFDTIDETLDYLETVFKDPRPLADLLYNDLSPLLKVPLSGSYVGESYLGVTACDHLAFRGKSLDWQFWVERGEKPLIRKVVITYKELPGEPQFVAHLVEWDTQPELSDAIFQFSPPEGARQIRFVTLRKNDSEKGGAQ